MNNEDYHYKQLSVTRPKIGVHLEKKLIILFEIFLLHINSYKITGSSGPQKLSLFYSSNHYKWLPYQILGGNHRECPNQSTTTEIWPKQLNFMLAMSEESVRDTL